MYMCTLHMYQMYISCVVSYMFMPTVHLYTHWCKTHTHINFIARRYTILITLLNSGVPCTSCGMRFKSESAEEYRRHLDWHYQINRQEKEGTGKTSRNWYMHPEVSNVHKSFGDL